MTTDDFRRAPRWQKFIRPVLKVVDDGSTWKTKEIHVAVVDAMGLQESVTREVNDSGQPKAHNRAGWALSALRRAQAVTSVKNGESQITDLGRELLTTHPDEITQNDLRETPGYWDYEPRSRSPKNVVDSDDLPSYWFVGAAFGEDGGPSEDHTAEFVESGMWRAQQPHKYADLIKTMRPGERIAIKSTFTRKHDLPFDIDGQTASTMRIRATGTIVENPGDGDSVLVAWDSEESVPQEDWYFYTSRGTVWQVKEDVWTARALLNFTFDGAEQDYAAFLRAPYWAEKYSTWSDAETDDLEDDEEELVDAVTYTVDDIIAKGSFASADELNGYLDALRRKKNLILQGPPGTGKTWLAKRLAYALIGREDRSLIHAVQFHPTVSYEDFVRGWRPGGDGRLTLTDGLFLEVIEAAKSEPDTTHVLVIEEINRANLAQVMGELLTLLEADKRKGSEALRLAYPRGRDELIFIPENLYVIGTMNLADRSLAIVDFALRRRFAFADLAPQFNAAWRAWVGARNRIDDTFLRDLARRIDTLNGAIAGERSLGSQYRIGHSFFTPANPTAIDDPQAWLADIVEQEIHPLLSDYWFDDPARVEKETATLLGRS